MSLRAMPYPPTGIFCVSCRPRHSICRRGAGRAVRRGCNGDGGMSKVNRFVKTDKDEVTGKRTDALAQAMNLNVCFSDS